MKFFAGLARGPLQGRFRAFRAVVGLGFLVALATGCGSVPPDSEAAEASSAEAAAGAVDPADFSAERAWSHLEALVSIGPRETGTRGAARARAYMKDQLEAVGATVGEIVVSIPAAEEGADPREATHLVGWLLGESPDRFMLAASYDTRRVPGIEFVGANASASGPAMVLELARALSQRVRPYTLMFVLLDGDALPQIEPGGGFPGSRAFARHLDETGAFAATRLAVVYQQVADVDLQIARDLRSHHIYREFFWEAAAVVGRDVYFPADAGVDSVDAAHLEFIEQGLPRAVVIADPRFGGPDVPGSHAGTERDSLERCSADSLGVVGEVSLEALDRIAARLARIDRFRRSPLEDPLRETRPDGGQVPVGEPNAVQ